MKAAFLTFFLITAVAFSAAGQEEFILIDKPGKKKTKKIYPGTIISFRLKNDDKVYKNRILKLQDSLIIFDRYQIHLREIGLIRFPLSKRTKVYSSTMMFAGGVLVLIDVLNNGLDGEDSTFNQGILIAGGSLVAGGLAVRWLQKRNYRFEGKKKWRVRIIN